MTLHSKVVQVVTPHMDLTRLAFNEEETEVTLYLVNGKPITYKLEEYIDENIPHTGLISEFDTQHPFAKMMKEGKVIKRDEGKCTCGIKNYHVHCGICGRVLKIG